MTQQTADEVLMGGGGAPAWKFDEPGTTRAGTIASPPSTRQERDYDPNNPGGGDLKFFPSGDPIMGIIIEVQTEERDPANTEDDGKRTFYVEGRYIKEAVRNAVKASGASKLEVGAGLQVTFTHREDPMDKRSRKYWNVTYTPAANVALMGGPSALPQQPVQQQVPVQPQYVQTPQGLIDTTTGQVVAPPQQAAPVQQVPAPPAAAPPATPGPTPEAIAALRAAGVDPATVYPGYTG